MPEERECEWCGRTLEQNEKEKDQAFAVRTHCNKSCGSLHGAAKRAKAKKIAKKGTK